MSNKQSICKIWSFVDETVLMSYQLQTTPERYQVRYFVDCSFLLLDKKKRTKEKSRQNNASALKANTPPLFCRADTHWEIVLDVSIVIIGTHFSDEPIFLIPNKDREFKVLTA